MTHAERMKAIRNSSDWLTRLTFNCSNEAKKEIDLAIEVLAPIISGEMVIVPAALLHTIYNEAFKQGMREHTHHDGGKSWNDSKFPALIKASQE